MDSACVEVHTSLNFLSGGSSRVEGTCNPFQLHSPSLTPPPPRLNACRSRGIASSSCRSASSRTLVQLAGGRMRWSFLPATHRCDQSSGNVGPSGSLSSLSAFAPLPPSSPFSGCPAA
ncbi:hypothetical protein ACQY0O_005597 [Thecaphora frezii]